MKTSRITLIGAVVVTWFVASLAFYYGYTQRYLRIYEASAASDVPRPTGPVAYQGKKKVEVGIACINAGFKMDEDCRAVQAAHVCAQLSCQAGQCADLGSCEAAEEYDHATCSIWEQMCGIQAPGPGGGGSSPPGNPAPGCQPWDVICGVLEGLSQGILEAQEEADE